MRYIKLLFKIWTVIVFLAVLFTFGAGYYLKSNKAIIFKELEEWYSQNYHGVLTVEDVTVSTFQNFPSVALVVKNVAISDTIYQKGKTETFVAGEIHLLVSFQQLLQKQIQFKSFKIKNGSLKLITDKVGNNNHKVFKKKTKDSLQKSSVKNWISDNNIKIQIENFDVSIIEHQKNKRITGKVNDLSTTVSIDKDLISADVDMDIFMKEMGLNLEKGTYFNGAQLKANFNPVYNKKTKIVEIPFFDMKIDKQLFKVKAIINTNDAWSFDFVLENKQTDTKTTLALLTQHLQKKLDKYAISKPIYTYTTLQGSFAFGSNPLVKIKGHTSNNSASIGDIKLENFEFDGEFFNRIYEDKRAETENKKDLTLRFKVFKGSYKNIDFDFTKCKLLSTPKMLNYLDFNVEAFGKTKALNDLFNSDAFLFKKGNFTIKTAFKGNVLTIDSLLVRTSTVLTIGKSELLYAPLSLVFPIDTLHLELIKKNAYISILSIPVSDKGNSIQFKGNMLNATSLVFDSNDRVQTKVDMISKELTWEDFNALFNNIKQGENQAKVQTQAQTQAKSKEMLNLALKGIYNKFNPSLNISINDFQYKNFEINNLTTGFYFEGQNHFHLEQTNFNYHKGKVAMDVLMDITNDSLTVFDVNLDTDKIDLGIFLKDFNYFNSKSLKDIKKLAGKISLNADIGGKLNNDTGLIKESLNGTIYFELIDVQIKGFKPLEKVANKVFRKTRFEDIRFAPIRNTVTISDSSLQIPQMQIQSSAFEFFVEGHLDNTHTSDIWVTLPLSNLKKRDGNEIPELQEFDHTGKKLYVEVIENAEGKFEYKLHLNNKKLYEEKGILDQYKEDKKENEQSFKEYKKAEREERRAQRRKANTKKAEN
jgi:hypothetical protein